MLHKTGCGGFQVSRGRYFAALGTVELSSTFRALPRLETARRWRSEAPEGFEFSMRAPSSITHPSTGVIGHFRPGPKLRDAWAAARAVAEALSARFVVFDTPASFHPDCDHLRDMYSFFKEIDRAGARCVWQPAGRWEARLAAQVCADLKLLRASDPLADKMTEGRAPCPMNYYRLPGSGFGPPGPGREYDDARLARILESCSGRPSYVFFRGRSGWADARRLLELGRGLS